MIFIEKAMYKEKFSIAIDTVDATPYGSKFISLNQLLKN